MWPVPVAIAVAVAVAASASISPSRGAFLVALRFRDQGFAGHLVLFGSRIHSKVFYVKDLSHLNHIGYLVGTVPVQFGNMEQYFVSGSFQVFHHGSEIEDLDDFNFIDTSLFGFEGNGVDFLKDFVNSLLIGSEDLNQTFSSNRVFVDHDGGSDESAASNQRFAEDDR